MFAYFKSLVAKRKARKVAESEYSRDYKRGYDWATARLNEGADPYLMLYGVGGILSEPLQKNAYDDGALAAIAASRGKGEPG